MTRRSSITATTNHNKSFQQFQNNLILLQQSLDKSNEVKNKIVNILDNFEHRFSRLQTEMTQINERIELLKLSHDNIDGTIKSIDSYLSKFGVPAQVEKRIEDGINNDLDYYLQCLDKVEYASIFFSKHQNFKGADKIGQQLQSLKAKAIQKLDQEFKNVLQIASKKEIDPFNLPKPLTEGLELISSDKLQQLHKIAKRLDSLSEIGYRKAYRDIRAKAIKKILQKIYPEKDKKDVMHAFKKAGNILTGKENLKIPQAIQRHSNITSSNPFSISLPQSFHKSSQKAQDTNQGGDIENAAQRFYKKGTHKFIFFMNFYLKLLEEEQRISEKVIFGSQTNSIFGEIISSSIAMFLEKADSLAQKKDSSERVFVLFDVLENLEHKLMNGFDQILGNTSQFMEKMQLLVKNIKQNVLQLLQEYNSQIQQNQTGIFAEGLVHEATSNAFTFLRKLMEYKMTVENLLPEFFGDHSKKEEKSLVGRYIRYMITEFVHKNIITKAKEYKQKSLQCIFMLNNDYYVLKKLKQPEFKEHVSEGLIRMYENQVKKDEEEYLSITWSKALSFLNMSNPKFVKDSKKTDQYTKAGKSEIKKCFKSFNAEFQDIYHTQRIYCIPDIELRERILSKTVEKVIPEYKTFLDYFGKVDFTKNPNKYITFPVQTLENMLCQFFDEESGKN